MHTRSEHRCVRDSGPCLRQITNTSRAVPSSALSCWENRNESFPCIKSESLPKRREYHLPISPGIPFGAARGRQWGGRLHKALPVLDFCTCEHRSLVSVSVSLSVSVSSPLNGNIFSSLYFDFLPLPSVLSTWRQNNYWAIKKEDIFLGHFSDNLLGCVTFVAEHDHSLSKTKHLGEQYIALFLGPSPCHLCGAVATPRAEGAGHSGHKILQQCLHGTASLFFGTEDELSSDTFKYHKTYQHL